MLVRDGRQPRRQGGRAQHRDGRGRGEGTAVGDGRQPGPATPGRRSAGSEVGTRSIPKSGVLGTFWTIPRKHPAREDGRVKEARPSPVGHSKEQRAGGPERWQTNTHPHTAGRDSHQAQATSSGRGCTSVHRACPPWCGAASKCRFQDPQPVRSRGDGAQVLPCPSKTRNCLYLRAQLC